MAGILPIQRKTQNQSINQSINQSAYLAFTSTAQYLKTMSLSRQFIFYFSIEGISYYHGQVRVTQTKNALGKLKF